MAKSVPADILQEIISRLPVKSLLRFRCVAKTWLALIDSPSFVKSHLKQSIITKSMVDFIFDNFGDCVILNHLCYENSGRIVVEKFMYLFSRQSESEFCFSQIIGSCNGLLYISYGDDAILFNPSTRNHCKIPGIEKVEGSLISPKRRILDLCDDEWFRGCGYDEMNNDYKLVGINRQRSFEDGKTESLGWIYSVTLGTWRRIDNKLNDHLAGRPKFGVFLCNAVHWLNFDEYSGVVAFDMGTEEFRLVPLPKYINENYPNLDLNYPPPPRNYKFNLHVLDECLCFCWSESDHASCSLEIWIMREYGANESNWTKLMKIDSDYGIGIKAMKPIAFSENGKLLLVYIREYDLAWYDLETGLLKRKVDNLPGYVGVPHFYIIFLPYLIPVQIMLDRIVSEINLSCKCVNIFHSSMDGDSNYFLLHYN